MRSLEHEFRTGTFITECGHNITIGEVKGIDGKYEGNQKIVIKGEKLNELGQDTKTIYFEDWKTLERKTMQFFGYMPELPVWTDKPGTPFEFINSKKMPTKSSIGMYEQVCTINGKQRKIIDLVCEILEGGKEYSAQELVNLIIKKFYSEVGIFTEMEIEERIKEINLRGLNNINFHESSGDKGQKSFNFEMSWIDLRNEMMEHPKIKIRGKKRGRLYRYISTRPRLPDKLVAAILVYRMKKLDFDFAEKNRSDMYNLLQTSLVEIHYFIEKGEPLEQPGVEYSEEKLQRMKEGYQKISLELDFESLQDDYRSDYEGDFIHWGFSTYSQEWFLTSYSNITTEMKKLGARPGSKRGTWTMYPKPKKQQTFLRSTQDILKLIEKMEIEIMRISKESQDEESVLDIGITGLASSIKRLEKKKIDFDKND